MLWNCCINIASLLLLFIKFETGWLLHYRWWVWFFSACNLQSILSWSWWCNWNVNISLFIFLSLSLVSFPLFTTWTICKCVVNLPSVKPRAEERDCFCFPLFIISIQLIPPLFFFSLSLSAKQKWQLCVTSSSSGPFCFTQSTSKPCKLFWA